MEKRSTGRGAKSVVEAQNMANLDEKEMASLVPDLRKKARDMYLKSREDDQLKLRKKILDDQRQMFGEAPDAS